MILLCSSQRIGKDVGMAYAGRQEASRCAGKELNSSQVHRFFVNREKCPHIVGCCKGVVFKGG